MEVPPEQHCKRNHDARVRFRRGTFVSGSAAARDVPNDIPQHDQTERDAEYPRDDVTHGNLHLCV